MKIDYAKEIYQQLVSPVKIKAIKSDAQFPGSKTYEIDVSPHQAKVMSWGSHSFIKLDNYTLQFSVRGFLFQGFVQIAYDLAEDLYNIRFVTLESNGVRKTHEEYKGVYFDEMHDIIDRHVEYDPKNIKD